MSDTPLWVTQIVVHQQELNEATWATLQSNGVGEHTRLRLDFTFYAPDRAAAERLLAGLRARTDYVVEAVAPSSESASSSWKVIGLTQGTTVSGEILDDWVRWMTVAGWAYGECRFDGWSTAVH